MATTVQLDTSLVDMVDVDRAYHLRKILSSRLTKHKNSYKNDNVKVKCSCGCNGRSNDLIGEAIADVFLRKQYWFNELNISQSDVSNQFIIQYDKLSEATINLLDISSLPADLARQRWVKGFELDIVRDSVATFCYLNNIGYWQGVHSIACAFTFLKPAPSLQELSILLEKILLRFAPIIGHNKSSITIQCAKQLYSLWNSLFQLFLPMTSAVLNDFCVTWNIDIFWTLGFHRFNCAYNCLYHWIFVIKCGNSLFAPTIDNILATEGDKLRINDNNSNGGIGHILSFLYFELAQNLLRHKFWQKTCGLQSLINNFSFDKQNYSIQDMMDLLSLCIQQEFQVNQLQYPPDVFINFSDYHFDDLCMEKTNISNYPMSLLVTLVKSLYLLTPKFIIKCINDFILDLNALNVHKKGHVDNNFQIETSKTNSPVDYDYMKFIKHFQVAKIELSQIISYIQSTPSTSFENDINTINLRLDKLKSSANKKLKHGIKLTSFKARSNFIYQFQEKTAGKTHSSALDNVMRDYYSSIDQICDLKSDTVQCLNSSDAVTTSGTEFSPPLSARKGDTDSIDIPILRKTISVNEAISPRSGLPSTPRSNATSFFRPRVKPRNESELIKLDRCDWPFFYSTVFSKFVFVDLTNEFLLPKEFKGGKTIYYSNGYFHCYSKNANKLEQIHNFKELVSEIAPIKSPFGYTLNSTCWIIVTLCNQDCTNTEHFCYDGNLDFVTGFIQRELMFIGASFILHYQGNYFALAEYINTLAEAHIFSGIMSRIGLRPGALWFNSQPTFAPDNCKLRPIDYSLYSNRSFNIPSNDLFFRFKQISRKGVSEVMSFLRKYHYVSLEKSRIIFVKIQEKVNKRHDFIFRRILPKIGIYLSHIQSKECYISNKKHTKIYPKFMKTFKLRHSKMRLLKLRDKFINSTMLMVKSIGYSIHPLIFKIKITSPAGTLPMYIDLLNKMGVLAYSLSMCKYFWGFILMQLRKSSDILKENVTSNTKNILKRNDKSIVKRTTTISQTTMRTISMGNRYNQINLDIVKNATLRDVQNVKNVALRRCGTSLFSDTRINGNDFNFSNNYMVGNTNARYGQIDQVNSIGRVNLIEYVGRNQKVGVKSNAVNCANSGMVIHRPFVRVKRSSTTLRGLNMQRP